MNAGIADAMDLSWQLAAHLNGWASSSVLEGYEIERLPITEQVSRFAMRHAMGAIAERTSIPRDIEEASAAGAALRKRIGEAAYALHVQQFACAGLNFGYFYENSPLIIYDGEAAPAYSMYDYTASTVPGCRLPHLWLADGRSLYDSLGAEFTLLRFDRSVAVEPLTSAARRRRIPLTVLDVDSGGVPEPYRHSLCVARPDGHVGWRGDGPPAEPDGVWAKMTGATLGG
jgi:hypothetical protein